jgi:hypothetical protein
MKKIFNIFLMFAVVLFFTDSFAQHKIDYAFKVRYKKTFSFGGYAWVTTTVDSGSFNEGQEYIVPPFTMPSEASVLQPAYDAIVGSVFKIDQGALNDNLFLDITLDSLDLNSGHYVNIFGDTVFVVLKIDVFVNGQPYPGHYFMNPNKYITYSIPKTPAFLNFLSTLHLLATDLGFAYVGPSGWVASGIFTFNDTDSVRFAAVHLSKFGGGRGHISSGVGIGELGGEIPTKYALEQNYPNPFNPTTVIRYAIPKDGFVQLKVYNVLGVEVASLVSRLQKAGTYEVTFDASKLGSGVYFYSLKTNNIALTKKMMLVK